MARRAIIFITLALAAGLLPILPAGAAPSTCAGMPVTIPGGPAAEVIVGTPADDVIHGRGGNDTILGRGGNDTICGGNGDDIINGGPGADLLIGGNGEDALRGLRGADQLQGGPGADTVFYNTATRAVNVSLLGGTASGEGADTLTGIENVVGSRYADTITGNGNANTIEGRAGHDKLRGRRGADLLVGGTGRDRLTGGAGEDVCRSGERYSSCLEGIALSPVATLPGGHVPVLVTAPAGDDRLFIVDQAGLIRIVDGGALLPDPFIDVSGKTSFSGERGLLGMAFHPGYSANGRLFLAYTNKSGSRLVVAEFAVSADPDIAQPAKVRTIITIPQPASNHNGGMLVFGPDGMLFISSGDGGGGGDPYGHGQDTSTLNGAILRIDVDSGTPYAVPADNPFAAGGGAAEIWAYGLRNPWRFSFDDGLMYIGDVGQSAREEIDIAPADDAGLNYGWSILEGTRCYPTGSGCVPGTTTLPAYEYGHGSGCSVIGGYVYRGEAMPELEGRYLFGDFCSRWIDDLLYQDGTARRGRRWATTPAGLTSFGRDSSGELYATTSNGSIWRLTPQR